VTTRALLLLLAISVACKPAGKQPADAKPGAGPQFTATVVSIRATSEPEKKSTNHEIVIANGRARDLSRLDVWELYDTKAGTVTVVNDLAKSYRVHPLPALLQRQQAALAASIPPHYPHAKLSRGASKPLLGVPAQQHVVEVGEYRRELWLAEHPSIPENLFAMMLAATAPSSRLEPMMRAAESELLQAKGFPLVDRTEIALGEQKLVYDRTVTAVGQRQVAEALLQVPKGYKDEKPPAAPR